MKKSKQKKKLQNLPEMQLLYKSTPIKNRPLGSSKDAVKLFREIFDKGTFQLQEEVILLALDDENYPLGFYKLGKGDRTTVIYNESDILRVLLLSGGHSFIIAHNHPTGSKYPSKTDVESTFAMKIKTQVLGLDYKDDIILTKKNYFSFAESKIYWERT